MNSTHTGDSQSSSATAAAIERHKLTARMAPVHDATGRLAGARLNRELARLNRLPCNLGEIQPISTKTNSDISLPAIYCTLAEDGTLLQLGDSGHGMMRPLAGLASLENSATHVDLANREITILTWSHSLLAVARYRSVLEGLLVYFKGNRAIMQAPSGKTLNIVLNFLCQNREGPLRRKFQALADIIDLEIEMARRQAGRRSEGSGYPYSGDQSTPSLPAS